MSRVQQGVMRVVQGVKEQATRRGDSGIKTGLKLSGDLDSKAVKAAIKSDKIKQAEESLKTVMYLSCWGP